MLQRDPADTGGSVLADPLDHLRGRPDQPARVLRAAAQPRVRVAGLPRPGHVPPGLLAQARLVLGDAEARHDAQPQRLATLGLARAGEPLAAVARTVRVDVEAVVLVGVAGGEARAAALRLAAEDDPRPRRLHRRRRRLVPVAGHLAELALELVHPLPHRREREAVALVLRLPPAGPHADVDPAAGHVV